MIGTDPQLGVSPALEAEIFVLLSPGERQDFLLAKNMFY